jgi:hypothetical protein
MPGSPELTNQTRTFKREKPGWCGTAHVCAGVAPGTTGTFPRNLAGQEGQAALRAVALRASLPALREPVGRRSRRRGTTPGTDAEGPTWWMLSSRR